MTAWPQYIVAGTMLFTLCSVANRTRDDEPAERIGAIVGTIIICGLVAGVLHANGFWEPMTR